ncbi:MAG: hypothetical protein J6D87_09455 [Clostridia bacterium]|nr:hypothetical protein [Clostridia bacterium]
MHQTDLMIGAYEPLAVIEILQINLKRSHKQTKFAFGASTQLNNGVLVKENGVKIWFMCV